MQPLPLSGSETFSSSPKPGTLEVATPHSTVTQVLELTNLLSISMDSPILDIS